MVEYTAGVYMLILSNVVISRHAIYKFNDGSIEANKIVSMVVKDNI